MISPLVIDEQAVLTCSVPWSTENSSEKGNKEMKRFGMVCLTLLLFSSFAFAGPKAYQVTGPVLELKSDSVVVQKGSEKWEIALDKDTKVTGELKVGSKVTVHYTMKATGVEGKSEEKKKEEKKKEEKKKK